MPCNGSSWVPGLNLVQSAKTGLNCTPARPSQSHNETGETHGATLQTLVRLMGAPREGCIPYGAVKGMSKVIPYTLGILRVYPCSKPPCVRKA